LVDRGKGDGVNSQISFSLNQDQTSKQHLVSHFSLSKANMNSSILSNSQQRPEDVDRELEEKLEDLKKNSNFSWQLCTSVKRQFPANIND
jgi:mevalonate pyrophosphate decarboxylase